MKNIVLTRIDERLIHGQVMTSWIKICEANTILIIDDISSSNSFYKRILVAAAPKNINLLVLNCSDAINYLNDEFIENERILILSKTPNTILQIIKGGIRLNELILGNMGGTPNRKKFYKNIFASNEEINELKEIVNNGVSVFIQMVPTDSKDNIKKLL